MRAAIIAIGDELLTGRTLDYNSHWISKRLTGLGYDVIIKIVVPDDLNAIIEAINFVLTKNVDLVVTTGGLGPTPGDLTLEAISKVVKRKMKVNPDALNMVKERYQQLYCLGFVSSPEITKEREKMAILPEGSIPFYNPIGVAPAVLLRKGSVCIVALPGVPSEMMYLLEQVLIHLSSEHRKIIVKTHEEYIEARDESLLAKILEDVMKKFPAVYIKSYPLGFGEKVKMRVIGIVKANDVKEADSLLSKAFDYLRKKLQEESDNL